MSYIKGFIKKKLKIRDFKKKMAKDFQANIAKPIEKAVLSDLEAGVSPVQRKRMPKYSKGYLKAIKRGAYSSDSKGVAPVTTKLTGALHKSFNVIAKGLKVTLGFSDKKAKWLNTTGLGKRKKKFRLLPTTKGEIFNARIRRITVKVMNDAVKKAKKG